MDQLQIDARLKMRFPGITPGETYTICGTQYTYTGLDIINDQLDDLSRDFPDLVDTANVDRMLSDPLGFTPPPFQLDPSIVAALTGDVDSLLGGAVGGALYGSLAAINDPFCGPLYTSKSQIEDAVKSALIGGAVGGAANALLSGGGVSDAIGGAVSGALGGGAIGSALGGGIAGALGGVAGNFLPAGIDAPVQAVKAAIDGVTKALPFKAAGAADIVNQIVLVKTLMNVGVKGPGAIIFAAVKSNFLSDIPGVSEAAEALNLQSEVASLAGLASNPIAFAAQAASISKNFPMINVNKIASKMIGGAITGALGGAGFNIKSMIPNMSLAKGLMGMLPIPGITPVFDALKPIKTAKPPKPKPPVKLKNLFAEAAAGSAMATLKQPLSQFMGILSTVAPQTNLTSDTASKTSYGEQKLNGNSNTANWSSGGYSRNTTTQLQEKRRLDISAKIENETQELLSQVDYSKLTRYSYQELVKKHPRITPTTSVLESLIIIEEDEAKANTAITTV
jgi:hypothetical protein